MIEIFTIELILLAAVFFALGRLTQPAVTGTSAAQATKTDVLKAKEQIMLSLEALKQKVEELTAQAAVQTETLNTVAVNVAKVGTETDGLNTKIQELKDIISAGGDTAALTDAVAALELQLSGVHTAVAAVKTGVEGVDAKVEDAAPQA